MDLSTDDEVVIDAMPYVDKEYDEPAMRARVDALVAAEMRRMEGGVAAYAARVPAAPAADWARTGSVGLVAKELERVAAKEPLPAVSDPRQVEGPAPDKVGSVDAWRACLDRSHTLLEYQRLRLTNLELLRKYGPRAVRAHTMQLDAVRTRLANELCQVQEATEAVNRKRKLAQLEAGERLQVLGRKWRALQSKNMRIEEACARVEAEIQTLKGAP